MYDKKLNYKVRLIKTLWVSDDRHKLPQDLSATFAVNIQHIDQKITRRK